MIDGWDSKETKTISNRLKTHSVEHRGEYSFMEVLQLLEMDTELFIPTSNELIQMLEDDLLDLETECYWDSDVFLDEEYRNSTFELIVLRGEK